MIVVFAVTVADQHAQHALLIWQQYRGGLHIYQPLHLANDLAYHGARFKRPHYGVRRFEQRAQLAEFLQPVAFQAYQRTRQVADLVVTRSERGCMRRDRLLRGRQ